MRRTSVVAVLTAVSMIVAARSVGAQSAQKRNGSAAAPAPSISTGRPNAPRAPEPRPSQAPPPTTPAAPELSPFTANPSTYAPHDGRPLRVRPKRFRSFSPDYGYAVPFSAGVVAPAVESRDWPGRQMDASGSLQLEVEPRTAQVYVDGFYLGTIDDFEGAGVMLAAGRHRVDLRSPGYETLTIPVEIAARADGQPTRFRGALSALPQAPLPAVLPRRPETMYVIPGCYAGNRPPRESRLARGCDIARLRVLN